MRGGEGVLGQHKPAATSFGGGRKESLSSESDLLLQLVAVLEALFRVARESSERQYLCVRVLQKVSKYVVAVRC